MNKFTLSVPSQICRRLGPDRPKSLAHQLWRLSRVWEGTRSASKHRLKSSWLRGELFWGARGVMCASGRNDSHAAHNNDAWATKGNRQTSTPLDMR